MDASTLGWPILLPGSAALAAFGLALFFGLRQFNPFGRAVGVALGLAGLIQLGDCLSLLKGPSAELWWRMGAAAEFLLPGSLFWVGAGLLGAADSVVRRSARARALVATTLGSLGALLCFTEWVLRLRRSDAGWSVAVLGPWGRVAYGILIPLLAFGIAQFEALLRATRYPARYGLKFVLVGLALPATYEVYFASQLLLLGVTQRQPAVGAAVATLLAGVLVTLGMGRGQASALARVYVSPQIVYGSVTFLVIGLYLLAVGALGEAIRQSWPTYGVRLSDLLVLPALAALAVALLSRRAQTELRLLVSRHIYRSKYDYRAKWLEVTEAFEGAQSLDALLDRLLDLLGRTFGSGRLSLFLRFEADHRFHLVRSVNIEAPPPPLAEAHPLIEALRGSESPLLVGPLPGADDDDKQIDSFRQVTQAVLCAPVRSQGELIAFVALGSERGGEGYGTDDLNLLRAITYHAGVLLSQVRLAEERRDAAELEALHRVSAFCVHDLKNLAARLSLVAGNAETHGADPEFQRSALKTVARTSAEMMDLVRRLSRRAVPPSAATAVDLDQVIEETLASIHGAIRATVRREGTPVPYVSATKQELQQVLLNLVLNAADAVQETGRAAAEPIVIRTEASGKSVILTVTDHGPGLAPTVLQTIFQPFRSTKSDGLGIGLYECKKIIESHGGSIEARSEPGAGTQFRVELPIWREGGVGPRSQTPAAGQLGGVRIRSDNAD